MVKIKFLGHSSFLIGFSKSNVLIDPFINTSSKEPAFERIIPSPVKENQLKKIDLILVSHEHFDHFDKKAIESIALANNSVVISHDSILSQLNLSKNQLMPISLGQKLNLRNTEIKAVTAHHPHSFYPMGFLLKADNKRIYHAGDTSLTERFSEIKTDIALLPIGGKITMDVVDAVRATKSMKPKIAIPMHYNTFPLIKADPKEFKQKIEKSILNTKTKIMNLGQSLKF